jgi:hypothetical protein
VETGEGPEEMGTVGDGGEEAGTVGDGEEELGTVGDGVGDGGPATAEEMGDQRRRVQGQQGGDADGAWVGVRVGLGHRGWRGRG